MVRHSTSPSKLICVHRTHRNPASVKRCGNVNESDQYTGIIICGYRAGAMIAGSATLPNGAVLAGTGKRFVQLITSPVPPATVDRIFPAWETIAREASEATLSDRFIELITPDAQ